MTREVVLLPRAQRLLRQWGVLPRASGSSRSCYAGLGLKTTREVVVPAEAQVYSEKMCAIEDEDSSEKICVALSTRLVEKQSLCPETESLLQEAAKFPNCLEAIGT